MRNPAKHFFAIGVAGVAVAACSTMILPGPDDSIYASPDTALVERGRYLVHGPAHCSACHGDDFGGGRQFDLGPLGTAVAPNITSDPAYGVGALADETLVRSLRYGISRDGRVLIPLMSFSGLTDEDLRAILSYLRTAPPVSRPAPGHRLSLLGRIGIKFFFLRPQATSSPPARIEPERTAQ
jgi:mono/diheme cytochrome c family protein